MVTFYGVKALHSAMLFVVCLTIHDLLAHATLDPSWWAADYWGNGFVSWWIWIGIWLHGAGAVLRAWLFLAQIEPPPQRANSGL